MKLIVKVIRIAPLLIFCLLPTEASAQLVQCTGLDCNFCTFTATVNTAIQWLVAILTLVAVMMMVYAGFKMVVSTGNTSAVQEAKKLLINVIIGFIIVLAAWTIVDTLIKALAGGDLGVWNPAGDDCGAMFDANNPGTRNFADPEYDTTLVSDSCSPGTANFPACAQVPNGTTDSGGTSISPDLGNLTSLRAAGANVASWNGIDGPGRTDMAHPTVVSAVLRAQQLGKQRFGVTPFQVTAAYTDGVGHSANSMHYQGIAVDLDPINGISTTQVAQLANEVGFSFVLDEGSHVHADMR